MLIPGIAWHLRSVGFLRLVLALETGISVWEEERPVEARKEGEIKCTLNLHFY